MTKILTDLTPDDPVVLNASYQIGSSADRRRIDQQILGTQQMLADTLLNGAVCTWYTLSPSSPPLSSGMAFCVGADGLMTKGVSAAIAAAGSPSGIAVTAVASGTLFRGVVMGLVSPAISGVGAGPAGNVRVNPTTALIERVRTPSGGDVLIGTTDANGAVTMRPINGTYLAPPPTGIAAIDTPNLQVLCAFLVASPGSTLQLASSPSADYRVNQDLILDSVHGGTIRGGGGSFLSGSRIVREGKGARTMVTASFTQPDPALAVSGARTAIGTVLVSVSSTAAFSALPLASVGKIVEVDALTGAMAPTPTYYTIINVTNGTTLELKPTSYNQVLAGATVPALGRLRTSDAVIQGRSATGLKLQGVSLVALDPEFPGSLLLSDGRIFGHDCSHNHCTQSTLQTQNYANVLPTVYAFGAASPLADTLTGVCSTALRLRVEYTGTTTYRYTTAFREGGVPFDWEESGLSSGAGAHALLKGGVATGLTWTPVNAAHTVGTIYEATVGASAMTVINGFNCTLDESAIAYLFDGGNMTGVGNRVGPQIDSQAIGGQVAWMNGNKVRVDISPEPSGFPGFGGFQLYNCLGVGVHCVSGDAAAAGPWGILDNCSGNLDLTCAINLGAVGAAGAVLRMSGCPAITIDGDFSLAPLVANFAGPSQNGVCVIGNIVPPVGATFSTITTGTHLNELDWRGPGYNAITSAVLKGLPLIETGLRQQQQSQSMTAGTVTDYSCNSMILELSGWTTTPQVVNSIVWSNLGEGARLILKWDASLLPITFKHQAGISATPSNDIYTDTKQDVTIRGGYVELYHDSVVNKWRLIDHGQAVPRINPQAGTSYTVAAPDFGSLIKTTNAAAVSITLNQDIAAAGETVSILQYGAGQVTAAAGTGVSFAPSKSLKTRAQGSVINATCLDATHGATIFQISGDMA